MKHYYTANNIRKGNLGEYAVQEAFRSLGLNINKHYANRGGLDIEGPIIETEGWNIKESLVSKFKIIGEVINWYGGYIHPERFKDIIAKLSEKSLIKFFFSFGVGPTIEEKQILKATNVHLIHLPYQVLEVTKEVIATLELKILDVITLLFSINKSIVIKSFKPSRRIVNESISVNSIDKVISRLKNSMLIVEKKIQNHDSMSVTVSNNKYR